MKKEGFLAGDIFENIPTSDLINFVDNGILLEKAKALFFLAQRCGENEDLIPKVIEKIFNRNNRQAKVIGTTSISFLAIGGLLEANTSTTKKIIDDFIKTLSLDEYKDLIDFLKVFN